MSEPSTLTKLSRYPLNTCAEMIYRNALLNPDKEAFIWRDSRITFRGYNQRVNRLVHTLYAAGLSKGDVVGTFCWNCIEVADAFGAAMKGGFIVAPFNARLQAEEISQVIHDSGATILLVDPECAQILEQVRHQLPELGTCISVQGEVAGCTSYDAWTAAHSEEEPEVCVDEDSPYLIIYTSGTTGAPKGALYTQQQRLENTRVQITSLGLRSDDRNLLILPLFHIAASVVWSFFDAGATTILSAMRNFSAEETLRSIAEEHATFIHIVPTQLVGFLASDELKQHDLSCLTGIFYAASPMPLELLRQGMEVFGPIFMQAYGQSESGPDITILPKKDHDVLDQPEERQKVLASAGRPRPGAQVRIVDADGHDLAHGEVGEIIVRSKAVMAGYWRKPEETAATIVDGWLHTGDMAYGDEAGYVYIVDRKKDMIISGGENVYPREVEEVLYRHPAVLEVAVIGLPDPRWIERVHAVVVLKQGATAAPEELRSFCKQHLAGYKVPKSMEITTALPKNATGKILKKTLRERTANA
ncbi:MAG: long-chain-fatty-acid--CoA ligase [Deferrisomatales bacterium]|nr:long-chain-fatty-acid--CoA ligase [Deferrisomatales bacterium]